MKRTPYVVLLVCLAGSVAAAFANSSASPSDRSADEAAIRKIDVAWSQAAEIKDMDGAVAPYDADGSVLPFNAPIATGAVAIRQVWFSLMSKHVVTCKKLGGTWKAVANIFRRNKAWNHREEETFRRFTRRNEISDSA